MFLILKSYPEALSEANLALKLDTTDTTSLMNKAFAVYYLGDEAEAKKIANQVLKQKGVSAEDIDYTHASAYSLLNDKKNMINSLVRMKKLAKYGSMLAATFDPDFINKFMYKTYEGIKKT